jgi:hypothetical protein
MKLAEPTDRGGTIDGQGSAERIKTQGAVAPRVFRRLAWQVSLFYNR